MNSLHFEAHTFSGKIGTKIRNIGLDMGIKTKRKIMTVHQELKMKRKQGTKDKQFLSVSIKNDQLI